GRDPLSVDAILDKSSTRETTNKELNKENSQSSITLLVSKLYNMFNLNDYSGMNDYVPLFHPRMSKALDLSLNMATSEFALQSGRQPTSQQLQAAAALNFLHAKNFFELTVETARIKEKHLETEITELRSELSKEQENRKRLEHDINDLRRIRGILIKKLKRQNKNSTKQFCESSNSNGKVSVTGIDDEIDTDVDIEDEPIKSDETTETITASETLQDEVEDSNRMPTSPDFHTIHVFIQPPKSELIAGKLTKMLIGTRNNGSQNFVVENVEASFRYPQDFTYYIQNFSTIRYEKVLEPGYESTFEYTFVPSETFNSRPMDFVVLLNYRNSEGKRFQNAVFNNTINFIEVDEGFDGETFFLYVFLGGILLLLAVLGYQFFVSWRPRRGGSKQISNNAQTTSQTKGSYDLDWIPKHHLVQNRSPKKSPRQRKSRQSAQTGATLSSENED
ncbi:unnamed protein product, partial [Didymodactylos carnosus]